MDFDQTTETNITLSNVMDLPLASTRQTHQSYPDLTEQNQNSEEELEPTLEIEHPILSGFLLIGKND
ncbi:MAG TPA: hypothetical protein ENJ84_00540 [Gammaproteobacteria bacterium]|nr:hypothetical protein [Gammaproteobacteria bacterium]